MINLKSKIQTKVILTLTLVLLASLPSYSIEYIDIDPTLRTFKYQTIAKNTFLKGILMHEVSSEINSIGDRIKAYNLFDIMLEEAVAIPKNSIFIGHITEIEKAQQGRDGLMRISIDEINYPDGTKKAIEAHIYSKKENGIIGGDFTPRSDYRKVVHKSWGLRTGVIQAIPDGPRLFGKETKLKAGTDITIQLDKDIKMYIIP